MSDHGTALVGQWTELVAEVVRQILRADDPRLPAVLAKYSNGQGGFQGALLKSDLEVALLSPKKESELLRLIKSVAVSGAKKFVAKDQLNQAQANIGWTGSNFKKLFDNIEENVTDIAVAVHRLEQSSWNAPIMTKLGGRVEIKLAHFFELLKRQSKGESGVLLVNSYSNVAYIKGNDGSLWAVGASWDSGSGFWYVEARLVEFPCRWDAGDQVLSRDS